MGYRTDLGVVLRSRTTVTPRSHGESGDPPKAGWAYVTIRPFSRLVQDKSPSQLVLAS